MTDACSIYSFNVVQSNPKQQLRSVKTGQKGRNLSPKSEHAAIFAQSQLD